MKRAIHPISTLVLLIAVLVLASTHLPADTGTCGGAMTTLPFTDVMGSIFFCPIAEAYFSGLTNGTTPTTYSPADPVLRDQMAAFVTRTQDSALRRGSRRAALGQWAFPSTLPLSARTAVGTSPKQVKYDGTDLWVADGGGDVKQVRANTGAVVGTWTGAAGAAGVLVARGLVFITGDFSPGHLYTINPATAPGPVTPLSSTLGNFPQDLTTDGALIWTANLSGSVSEVNPDNGLGFNLVTGFSSPTGIVFDGANLWVTDQGDSKLKKLDSAGAVIQAVTVGTTPVSPVFDGSNIWVPNSASNNVTVVRVRDGVVLATLTGNGLNNPGGAAFDGQFILVTNGSGNSLSLWKAADLTPTGSFATGAGTDPLGACSDGINFWITLQITNQLARF